MRINKFLFVVILISIVVNSFAQNIDSLFNRFVADFTRPEESQFTEKNKCGFILLNEVFQNRSRFSANQQEQIFKISSRPSMDTSFVSPQGYFRIHFYKSPDLSPQFDVDKFAIIADSVYDFEILQLGYPVPMSDNNLGGDSKYDIYILPISDWGTTIPDFQTENTKQSSFIKFDNDFSRKRTPGWDGIRITIAHEFHHAIQIGGYGFFYRDAYYHEITSTSMEEFFCDRANDYYWEIPKYLKRTYKRISLPNNVGYDRTIFNLFLKENFDIDIIKKVWEYMGEGNRAMIAVNKALQNYGSNFETAFAQFGKWCYFTGSRSKIGKYFEEAASYPMLQSFLTYYVDNQHYLISDLMINTEPASNTFVTVIDTLNNNYRKFDFLFSNTDYSNADNYSTSNNTSLKFSFANYQFPNARELKSNYYSYFTCLSDNLISETKFYNDDLLNRNNINTEELYPFPQPFVYSKYTTLIIPLPEDFNSKVTLKIFSVSFELIFDSERTVLKSSEKKYISWNCLDNRNKKLSTGIYFYVVNWNGNLIKNKFAVIND